MSYISPPQGYQANPVVLREVSMAGAATLDTGELLTKDVLARTELFYEDNQGIQIQLTSGGKINSAAMAIGTADQVFATNNTGTGTEYKTLTAGTNITSIVGAAGTLTVNASQTPTITSFLNAAHNHTDVAGGAQITDAALSAAVGLGKGGTGMTSTGTANQIAGMVAVPGGMEWKSFANGTGITVVHTANTITITNTLPGVTDHGLLDAPSLLDDDHTQYALLAGRATAQTLIFGTGAGGAATITATSHATAGPIIFNGKPSLEFARFLATGTLIIGQATAFGSELLGVLGTIQIQKSVAGSFTSQIYNPSDSGEATLQVVAGTTGPVTMGLKTAYAASAPFAAKEIGLYGSSGVTGVIIGSAGATAPVRILANAIEFARFAYAGTGELLVGSAVAGGGGGANYPMQVWRSANAAVQAQFYNATDGTASRQMIYAACGTGTAYQGGIEATSATFTPALGMIAGDIAFRTSNGLALSLVANADIPIRFVTGATPTEKMRLLTTGELIVGATTVYNGDWLTAQNSVNGKTGIASYNANTGAAAYSALTAYANTSTIGIFATSSGYTPGSGRVANEAVMYMNGTAMNTIQAAGAAIPIRFLAGAAGIETARLTQLSTSRTEFLLATTVASTTGYAYFSVRNDASNNISMMQTSTTYTPGGGFLANDSVLYSYGSACLTLMTQNDVPIRFVTGATPTEKMRLLTTGVFLIGATTATGTENLYVAGAIRGITTAWLGCPATAPADATLTASQVTWSVNESTHVLTFKVKYSDNTTVKNGAVALV